MNVDQLAEDLEIAVEDHVPLLTAPDMVQRHNLDLSQIASIAHGLYLTLSAGAFGLMATELVKGGAGELGKGLAQSASQILKKWAGGGDKDEVGVKSQMAEAADLLAKTKSTIGDEYVERFVVAGEEALRTKLEGDGFGQPEARALARSVALVAEAHLVTNE